MTRKKASDLLAAGLEAAYGKLEDGDEFTNVSFVIVPTPHQLR